MTGTTATSARREQEHPCLGKAPEVPSPAHPLASHCRYRGQTDCRTHIICHPQEGSTCVPDDLRLVGGQKRGFTPSSGALTSRDDYSPCVLISRINASSLSASYSILGLSEMRQTQLHGAGGSETFPTLSSASSLPSLLPQLLSSPPASSPRTGRAKPTRSPSPLRERPSHPVSTNPHLPLLPEHRADPPALNPCPRSFVSSGAKATASLHLQTKVLLMMETSAGGAGMSWELQGQGCSAHS